MPLYKVKISHPSDKGTAVMDTYIVEATSVIDAESKIATSSLFYEYTVESITKPRISSVLNSDGDNYYRCKTAVTSVPDKVTTYYDLVQADTFDEAVDKLKGRFKDFCYEIQFVELTPIKGFLS